MSEQEQPVAQLVGYGELVIEPPGKKEVNSDGNRTEAE